MGSMFHLADAASSYAELQVEKTCQTDLISCLDIHSIFREKNISSSFGMEALPLTLENQDVQVCR